MNKLIKLSVAWGRNFLRTFHKEAAEDSLRNVLAVVGFGTLVGDFAQMRLIFVLPAVFLLFAVWIGDYHRHWRGESIEESCARELQEVR